MEGQSKCKSLIRVANVLCIYLQDILLTKWTITLILYDLSTHTRSEIHYLQQLVPFS